MLHRLDDTLKISTNVFQCVEDGLRERSLRTGILRRLYGTLSGLVWHLGVHPSTSSTEGMDCRVGFRSKLTACPFICSEIY